MPGKLIVLDLEFTDTTLPKVPIPDTMLTTGSLLLVDPTNLQGAWDAGVPGSGTLLPNLAWVPAQAAIGAGTEETLAAIWSNDITAGNGLFERSTKGGLHGIIKQQAFVAGQNAVLSCGPVRDYLAAHPGHAFFLSVWGRLTRDDTYTSTGASQRMAGINTSTDTDFLTIRRATAGAMAGLPSASRIGSRTANRSLAPFIVNCALSSLSGTANSSQSLLRWSNGPSEGGQTKGQSWVFYRLYLEDLTVSGRSYAAVDGLDSGLFTAAVLTNGGRYYGDTYTNPTTIV